MLWATFLPFSCTNICVTTGFDKLIDVELKLKPLSFCFIWYLVNHLSFMVHVIKIFRLLLTSFCFLFNNYSICVSFWYCLFHVVVISFKLYGRHWSTQLMFSLVILYLFFLQFNSSLISYLQKKSVDVLWNISAGFPRSGRKNSLKTRNQSTHTCIECTSNSCRSYLIWKVRVMS